MLNHDDVIGHWHIPYCSTCTGDGCDRDQDSGDSGDGGGGGGGAALACIADAAAAAAESEAAEEAEEEGEGDTFVNASRLARALAIATASSIRWSAITAE